MDTIYLELFKAEVSRFLSPGSASNLMVDSRHRTDDMHCVRQTLLPGPGIDDVVGPTVENAALTRGTEKRRKPDVGCPFLAAQTSKERVELQRFRATF